MLSQITARLFRTAPAGLAQTVSQTVSDAFNQVIEGGDISAEESTILRTLGWVTAGLGAVAVGLFVGRELRQRYKFNRRTPYDFYAHSGDEQELEFGVGV